ncbi:MAG: four helix bundle protein [Phycisphaerae bacterium]
MGTIRSYRDLVAWQKGMDLVEMIYELTSKYPDRERYGLTSQSRRSAVSVPANIAEGYARRSRKDYIRFLDIARGSANELETELLVAQRLGLLSRSSFRQALESLGELQRVLGGLIASVSRSVNSPVRDCSKGPAE